MSPYGHAAAAAYWVSYATDLMLILMYGILMNVCRCFNILPVHLSKWIAHCKRIGCAFRKRVCIFSLLYCRSLLHSQCHSASAKMNCYYFRILWNRYVCSTCCICRFFQMVIRLSWGSAWP